MKDKSNRWRIIYQILIITLVLNSCSKPNADYIIYNAKIYTVNEAFDTAQVMVIKEGKILDIGGLDLLNTYRAVNKINAQGRYIYPGFNDAHCHFTGYAMDKYKLALFGTDSFEEVVAAVVDYGARNTRQWIEGRGWDQNDWDVKEFPTKDTLDKLFPNTPIFLMRIDGHAALCNQKALELAGITLNTKIEGGEILQKNNQLTGLLIDNAVDYVKKIIPIRTRDEVVADFVNAEKDCVSLGLSSVTDCGLKNQVAKWLEYAYEKKQLKIKTSFMLADEKDNYDDFLQSPFARTDRFHCIGYKVYSDGALGSRGAYLLEDYHDRHQHKGILLKSKDSLEALARLLYATDYQLCTHAIGDGANRLVLQSYASVLPADNDRRWRVEHAQVVSPEDLHYFKDYKTVPSVQPTHATSDMYWAEKRLGQNRIQSAYAYNDLLSQLGWMPLGTDFPVEELNPLYTFCAAVFRVDKKNFPDNGFQMNNALSRQDALRGMTIWAAKAAFEEKEKGSLEKGKWADFVILPIDLMTASVDTIYKSGVVATYINGECVYRNRK